MSNMFYFTISIIFLVTLSLAFIPYWTRKTENFGVSIPASQYNRSDFKAMRKKYTTSLVIINLILFSILIIASFKLQESTIIILFNCVIVIYIIFTFLFYLPFHFQMKKIKEKENWHEELKQTIVIDPKFRNEKLVISHYWYIIPAIITIFTFLFTWFVYENIPAQVPTHTSFSGEVTYNEKTIGNVFMLPFTQLFIIGLFFGIHFIIKFSKQQISSDNPKVSKQQNIIFRRRMSLFLFFTCTVMTLMFLFMQLTIVYQTLLQYQEFVVFLSVTFVMLGVIVLSVTTGQGGSRVKIPHEENRPQIERDDDRYWKLGQFYFNKNDPSIFVEKRFGIGWTNNWAHPLSWIFIIVIIALAIGLPIIINLL